MSLKALTDIIRILNSPEDKELSLPYWRLTLPKLILNKSYVPQNYVFFISHSDFFFQLRVVLTFNNLNFVRHC